MPHIRKAIVIACTLAAVSGTALAEDQGVLHRLSSNGGMRGASAKQLLAKVNKRMALAADTPPNMVDPVRVAMTQAMLGTPVPSDQMSAAKVRLKLYAGLNEFALESMFEPRKGAIATCVRDLSITKKDCTALVAAAGRVSVSKAKKKAAGPAAEPVMVAMPAASAPAKASVASNSGGSPFGGRFDSGYVAPSAPARTAQPAAAPTFAQRAQATQPQVAARPVQPAAAPVAAPRTAAAAAPAYVAAAPAAAPADAEARKEAYKAQREAYMARQRALFEERRAKIAGNIAPANDSTPVAAEKPAAREVAAKQPEQENALDSEMKAAVGESSAAAPAAGGGKAGLDGEFLDGLLDDPLGGAKKK